jgi:hypothetical protein
VPRKCNTTPSAGVSHSVKPLLFAAMPLSVVVLLFFGLIPWLLVMGVLIFLSFQGSQQSS